MALPKYRSETDPNKVIQTRRADLSLSQSELARKLGYKNTNFISMLENGQSLVPIDKAPAIAQALEVDPLWYTEMVFRLRHPEIAQLLLGDAKG